MNEIPRTDSPTVPADPVVAAKLPIYAASHTTAHHDGHGMNEHIAIYPVDKQGNGGAHHLWVAAVDGTEVARVQFQCGARGDPASTHGLTTEAALALVLQPLLEFQSGEFASQETALVIVKIQEAMHWCRARADDRARRRVLGRLAP